MEETFFKVPPIQPFLPIKSSNNNLFPSSPNYTYQINKVIEVEINKGLSGEKSLVIHMDSINKYTIYTLIDSGASDYCFANKSLFILYFSLNQNISSLSASINSTFNILRKGTIRFKTRVERKLKTITLNNIIYTSGLRSNLISILKLFEKGANILFLVTDNLVSIKMPNGPILFSAKRKGNLFYIDIEQDDYIVYLSQSVLKSVDFSTWHQHFAHTGVDMLQNIINNKLVNGLNTHSKMVLEGICKDCIFGKYTLSSHNGTTVKEKEVLKHVHISLWELAQLQSAGRAHYFIAITDGFSLY